MVEIDGVTGWGYFRTKNVICAECAFEFGFHAASDNRCPVTVESPWQSTWEWRSTYFTPGDTPTSLKSSKEGS